MTRQPLLIATVLLILTSSISAQEASMFGNTPSRNMVSGETGLVSEWDASTGSNVLWSVSYTHLTLPTILRV